MPRLLGGAAIGALGLERSACGLAYSAGLAVKLPMIAL